ncbi:TIGR01777 family oxidoreductase [Psychroserpens ponticola]|uniref:TIGR01777 family oxidoreductase n=1 Tax=Psychroserpens ponticola TaxID=2932268 RepID=A0ABY7RZ69_9FLAO|nr:TIGR01777 family oxidoreductase [Psychroserpens ponticola]WCO00990.1 TIGR01777 family oxidoreductase [Psychroserpens ponticola]
MKTITIAGGSGFLGQVLEAYFSKKGYKIFILTRTPQRDNEIYWNGKDLDRWSKTLEQTDILINLTGKSVDCRYNEENKKLIYDSRIDSTHLLGLAINLCDNPPKTWINSSTATIYSHSIDKEMTEDKGEIGDDFSMNIAKSWEKAFYAITNPKTRKIATRTSIVMGKYGGATEPLKKLVKFGLGGKQASGLQKVSWIHELDFARAIEFLIENENLNGNFNLAVPKPTDNKTLMKSFRKVMKIPFGISHPEWFIKLGAKLIGTEPELVLKSRNIIPKRLLDNKFKFIHSNIEIALDDLINL